MRYAYALTLLVFSVMFVWGLYSYALTRRDRWKTLRVRDLLFVWPLIIDTRRDEKGDFKLRRSEVIGIWVVVALMVAGVVFSAIQHQGR